MPPKRLRLRCQSIFALIPLALFLPATVAAQTGHVTLNATVSETVTLSIPLPPNMTQGNVRTTVVTSGNAVRITSSGSGSETPVIRVPLLVRSNSGFRISAAVESKTAVLTQLSVIDARATGTFVSPLAVSGLEVPPQFDSRALLESAPAALDPLDDSRPLLVVSGPRVSIGGTLDSPNNALQITLLIRLKPETPGDWLVHLSFAATAGSPTQ